MDAAGQILSTRQILEKLVSFPTVSRDSNLDLIDYVEGYLASHGVESTRVPDETGTKANLFAVIGPQVDGGVILSGHTDVVPVDGQDWSSDPFTLVEREGRLYGRGACDMKGFLALGLAAVPQMLKAGLKRPIHLALSHDEEIGCLGAPRMIDAMNRGSPKAASCIVGEPSMMRIVDGHKGVCGLTVQVRGFEVHSSLVPTGVSAVMVAARLITWLEDQMHANAAAPDPGNADYTPPYTTLHTGVISGGSAHNITALDCTFSVDIRAVPTESVSAWRDKFIAHCATVEAEMQAIRPETYIKVTERALVEGMRPEINGAAEAMMRRITGQNGTSKVPYGTEGGQFQTGGFSTIICGPGSIEQAHQPDEYLAMSQLEAGERFIADLITDLSR